MQESDLVWRFEVTECRLVQVAVYDEVENAAALRDCVVKGNLPCEAALIDASAIASRKHLMSAAYQAVRRFSVHSEPIVVKANDTAKSKTLHSELIYCASAGTSIAAALRSTGIQDNTRSLVLAAIDCEDFGALTSLIQGRQRPPESLDLLSDAKRMVIADRFKLSLDYEARPDQFEASLLTRLALKDIW